MLPEGQTEEEGSTQRQRKKGSHTKGHTIHAVYVCEKLCQLLVMKILEKKKKQWFRILLNTLVNSPLLPAFINKYIDNLI